MMRTRIELRADPRLERLFLELTGRSTADA